MINNLKNYLFLSLALITFCCCACKKETVKPVVEVTPRVTISGINLFEGNVGKTPFRIKINLSEASNKEVSLNFSTEALSAKGGEDFEEVKGGTLIIPIGITSAFIDVNVVADTLKEADEDFKVVFSNVKNAIFNQTEVTCTIRNDDTFVPFSNDGFTSPDSYAGYKLAWADEFNGTQIDPANWSYDTGGSGWGNQESQYYTNGKNASIQNGKLVIEARKEDFQSNKYTSSRLITKGKREFMFGRVDIRAKLPKGQGVWPALWALGANIDKVGWPACNEIDIMELLGHDPKTSYGTIHWGKQGDTKSQNTQGIYKLTSAKSFADEFHIFSLDWEKDQLSILVDDKVIFNTTATKLGAGNYIYNNPDFFIFNVAVGGLWPGYPDATTVFPQRMEVDYIRVFQK